MPHRDHVFALPQRRANPDHSVEPFRGVWPQVTGDRDGQVGFGSPFENAAAHCPGDRLTHRTDRRIVEQLCGDAQPGGLRPVPVHDARSTQELRYPRDLCQGGRHQPRGAALRKDNPSAGGLEALPQLPGRLFQNHGFLDQVGMAGK